MRVNNLHSYYNASSPGKALISSGRLLAERKKVAKKKKPKAPQAYSSTNLCHLGMLIESRVPLENIEVINHIEQTLEETLIPNQSHHEEPVFTTPVKTNAFSSDYSEIEVDSDENFDLNDQIELAEALYLKLTLAH